MKCSCTPQTGPFSLQRSSPVLSRKKTTIEKATRVPNSGEGCWGEVEEMCWVWQMRDISVFHIMEPSYLVIPKRNSTSQDSPVCWPWEAIGNARHGLAQGLQVVGSEGQRQLLAAQSLQRPHLLSHPPWEGCSDVSAGSHPWTGIPE